MSNFERTSRNQNHYAVFGNTIIPRGFCENCKASSFITDGCFSCCGNDAGEVSDFYKSECGAEGKRRQPKQTTKQEILESQNYRCCYCGKVFDSYVFRRGKAVKVKITWEHFIPFSLSYNNQDENFLAACQICNGIKYNKCFESVEEARIHIQIEREKKGYDEMSELPELYRANGKIKKILFPEVPDEALRENSKSEIQRCSVGNGNGESPENKPVERPKKNQKRQPAESQQVRQNLGSQRLFKLNKSVDTIGVDSYLAKVVRYFLDNYIASTRKFEALCHSFGLAIGSSSIHRAKDGSMGKEYANKIQPQLLSCLRMYLIQSGRSEQEADAELDQMAAWDSEEIVTIPKGKTIKIVVENSDGKKIQTLLITG